MNTLESKASEIQEILLHQLRNHWIDVDARIIENAVPEALRRIEEGFSGLPNSRFFDGEKVLFSPYMSIHWMIFLYRISRAIYENADGRTPKEADQCYYLNKIMHGNDWFYAVALPVHFLCEHPLGSVLGRARYGDYLFIYQGTTVGGNRSADGVLHYPTLGDNVMMFANSTVLGDTVIGNNVVISADTYIINTQIPDNCIVFGRSPDLTIKPVSEEEIKRYTSHIWNWRKER